MKKIWLVLKNEFINTVARKSFLLVLFLVPLIGSGVGWFTSMGSNQAPDSIQAIVGSPTSMKPEGLVNLSQIGVEVPERLQDKFILYPDMDSVRNAYKMGKIDSFYVIQSDYLESGRVIYYRNDFNPLGGLENTGPLTELLAYSLLHGDEQLVARTLNTMNLEIEYTSEQTVRDPSSSATFFVPYVVTFLFYTVIFGSATLMLNSVASEKQNRVIEILATSVKPIELMTGKIIALGMAGLLQVIVWSGAGLLVLNMVGRSLPDVAAFALPGSFFVWGFLFFILGYLLYGGLMAAVGALVPNLREASQMTMIMIVPLIIPLMFISELATNPNGGLAMALSLFPLTSPVAMMTRLTATAVPFWQPMLAVLLLMGTVFVILRGAAGIFRAQNLLAGKAINLKVFALALIGKE